MTESLLEMARRHLKESEDRIARQESLIRELIRDKRDHRLPQAYDLLDV